MTRGERRRQERARSRGRGQTPWLETALRVSQTLGPLAARHRHLVAILPPEVSQSGEAEVVCVDRGSGSLSCAGCGEKLTADVAVTTPLGGIEHAATAPTVVIRALCASCLPPGRGARA